MWRRGAGFSLIELLVTLVILSLILVVLLQFMSSLEQEWRTTAGDPFAEASAAFETMAERLADATLEPYQDFVDATGTFRAAGANGFVPDHLARQSDLAFVCGPSEGPGGWLTSSGETTAGDCVFFVSPTGYTQTEAHVGLERLLNAQGYFVEFGAATGVPGFILPAGQRYRWRLTQLVQPSEALQVYALPSSLSWVQSLMEPATPTSILAENVAALLLMPEWTSLDANNNTVTNVSYSYDSRNAASPLTRNQLPPRLTLVLVAIDEASAQILAARNGTQPPALIAGNLFATAANLQADLTSLDAALTAQKIGHRIFQRKIALAGSAWTETPSP
jgi:uncharacterized protein (TIGR02599 family)